MEGQQNDELDFVYKFFFILFPVVCVYCGIGDCGMCAGRKMVQKFRQEEVGRHRPAYDAGYGRGKEIRVGKHMSKRKGRGVHRM